jgi:hypothetical protein
MGPRYSRAFYEATMLENLRAPAGSDDVYLRGIGFDAVPGTDKNTAVYVDPSAVHPNCWIMLESSSTS